MDQEHEDKQLPDVCLINSICIQSQCIATHTNGHEAATASQAAEAAPAPLWNAMHDNKCETFYQHSKQTD